MKRNFLKGFIVVLAAAFMASMKPPAKLHVYLFLQAECPCVYTHKDSFRTLLKKYSGKVDFIAVFEGKNDSRPQMERLLNELEWKMPYKKDDNQRLARLYKPVVSTDCIVTDEKGSVVYRGAIDDGVKNMGMIKNFYLKEVLEALSTHKKAPYSYVAGTGCLLF